MRLLLFALFLLPCTLFSQIEDAKYIFRELRALDGTWFMPTDRGDRLEIWKVADDSTITCRVVRIKPENGDTVLIEGIRIEHRGEHIVYYSTVRNQNNNKAIAFEMTQADTEGYLFENPENEDPQKIRMRLLGNRELQVNLDGTRNGRPATTEYVFEREFNPGGVQLRLKAGITGNLLRQTGQFNNNFVDGPTFGGKPGWELGAQVAFKGRGGFLTLNFDLGLSGKYSTAKAEFYGDTVHYVRDVTYKSTWLIIAATPEITFKRDGRFSLLAGPYLGILLSNRTKGTDLPGTDNKLFKANNDFKKTDFGLCVGLQHKLNLTKKDLGGKIGIRANLGLKNIDNLYTRGSASTYSANGQVFFSGVSLYYSINLLGI